MYGKNKMKNIIYLKTKREKNIFLNAVLIIMFIFLMVMIVIGSYSYGILKSNKEDLYSKIEIQNRQSVRELLQVIQSGLEHDISSGLIDLENDDSFEKWIKDLMNHLELSDKYRSITLLRIGNITVNNNGYIGKYIWRNAVPPGSEEDYNDHEEYLSIDNFMMNQPKAKEYLLSINHSLANHKTIKFKDICKDEELMNIFIEKKILYFKNPYQVYISLEKIFSGLPSTRDDKVKWTNLNDEVGIVEWISIPKAFNMGINNEEKIKDGYINPNYNKITIVAVINDKYILNPYISTFEKYDYLSIFIKTIIIMCPVAVIIFMFYIVYTIQYKNCKSCSHNDNKL